MLNQRKHSPSSSSKPTEDVDEDDNYVGNMWGWRFSYISLAVIVFFTILLIIKKMNE